MSAEKYRLRRRLMLPDTKCLKLLLLLQLLPTVVNGMAGVDNLRPAHIGHPPSCSAECGTVGTCREAGPNTSECNCPIGWRGAACEENYLSACRLSYAPGAAMVPIYDGDVRQSCECHRQWVRHLNRTLCSVQNSPDGPNCFELFQGHRPCFEREQLPAHMQLSAVPEEHEEGVSYWNTFREDTPEPHKRRQVSRSEALSVSEFRVRVALPPGHCPQNCSDHGMCMGVKTANDFANNVDATKLSEDAVYQSECHCYAGFHGPHCGEAHSICFNECSGRGECVVGFCKCLPGFFGLACERDTVYPAPQGDGDSASTPTTPQGALRSRLPGRIYVYEPPTTLLWQPQVHLHHFYGADMHFLSMLLPDEVVRTQDPWEASLFMIPTYTLRYGSNVAWTSGAATHVLSLIEHVRTAWPFWNRTDGADHFFWSINDVGTVQWAHKHPLLETPIKVSHFGFDATHPKVWPGA
mmetsp:Transcript_26370/g.78295  ORF Transcript_26370/g.78295 Transcript_26370/m.78295 type:complete len:466 (-) Transcript_26370:911-2308(-)